MKKIRMKKLCMLVIWGSLTAPALAVPGSCDVIGGGEGYTAALLPENAPGYVTASTYDELKTYLDAGEKYIYIPSSATLTVPNKSSAVRIKAGQTIFSDRGVNGSSGALLQTPYLNENANAYPVYTVESGARITGLRIEGPYGEPNTNSKTIGMQFLPGSSGVEVDNNEIYNWPWSGVNIKASVDNKVHHNFIHNNIRSQLGYGVVVQNGNAQADIYCNTFNANRHAIAGSGSDGEGYNAHDNLVLPGGGRGAYHQFDMHKGPQGNGGKYVIANDNIFDYGAYGTSNRYSIYIRGVTTDGPLKVTGNIFTNPWNVGSQFSVGGVAGSVPSAEEIKATNRFNKKATYTQDSSGKCLVNVDGISLPVNCGSVASVLKK